MSLIIETGISIGTGINIIMEWGVPRLVSNPVASGNTTVRQTVSSTTGVWSTIIPPTYTYQWKANTANISGAIASTYNPAYTLVGSYLTCQVTATNLYGSNSAVSNSIGPVLSYSPLAPTAIIATSTNANTIQLSWTAPVDNGGAPITSYTVTSNIGNVNVTTSNTNTPITGLQTGQFYTFYVSATNISGTGPQGSSNAVQPLPNLGDNLYGGSVIEVNSILALICSSSTGQYRGTITGANSYTSGKNAANYNGYNDWFIPNRTQLTTMSNNRYAGGFVTSPTALAWYSSGTFAFNSGGMAYYWGRNFATSGPYPAGTEAPVTADNYWRILRSQFWPAP